MDNTLLLITSTVLTMLIYAVYRNNVEISKLNDNAKNINQYIKTGSTNDDFIFKQNDDIIKYLRSRDEMKSDLEKLKQDVKRNTQSNLKQNERLQKSDQINIEQNRMIQEIRDTYRSDMNHLVELSFSEVNKHFPNESNEENLKKYRELLYFYVFEMFAAYDTILPDRNLDEFLNDYGKDLSYIIAESIYQYEIFNLADSYPSHLLIQDEVINLLKDDKNLDFFIQTYFPRMFSYIDNNKRELFYKIEQTENAAVTRPLFTAEDDSDFIKYVTKDVDVEFGKLKLGIKNYLFVTLPTFYTKALFMNTGTNAYVRELDAMLSMSLDSCMSLERFFTVWKSFNLIKKATHNIVPETDKTKLLKNLIVTNLVFKRIYEEKLVEYNTVLSKLPKCDLPQIPAEYRTLILSDDIVYQNNVSSADDDSRLTNLLKLRLA